MVCGNVGFGSRECNQNKSSLGTISTTWTNSKKFYGAERGKGYLPLSSNRYRKKHNDFHYYMERKLRSVI